MAKAKNLSTSSGGKKKKKSGQKLHQLCGPMAASMKSLKPSRPNPFEMIWSRHKFDILGKKKGSGEEFRVGLSRSIAIEKRKETLMKEYEENSKSTKFIDRRLGEKDDTLQDFERAILRMQRQRQSKVKRASKYNLSDEEEGDMDDFNEQIPLDDYEDDGIAGASELPRDLHLQKEGDSLESDLLDGAERGHTSNKQAYAEVIAKDKYFKAKRAEEREETSREIAVLNKLTNELDDRLKALSNLNMKHSIEKQSDDMFDSYYKTMGELHFEPRGRPSERTKTLEEIAHEEREALENLEEERLSRMNVDVDEDEDEDEDNGLEKDKIKSSSRANKHVSGDDIDDSFSTIKHIGNERGWVDAIYEREQNEGQEDVTCSEGSEGSESIQDDQQGTEESEDDNVNDTLCTMHDWEQSDSDDDINVEEKQKVIAKACIDANILNSVKHHEMEVKEKHTQILEELPYVIEAPKKLAEICSLLDNRTDAEVAEIIRRIRACNSISLKQENRRKMQVFYGVILNYFAVLATRKPVNIKLINTLVKPLIEIGSEVPYFASICARERLICIRKQLSEDFKIPGKSSWPSLKTLNLFRIWSLTFSCSDFRHPVITPMTLLMCEYLMRCPITSGRDIAVGSFLCSILLAITKISQKYSPEVVCFFQMLLLSSLGMNSILELNSQNQLMLKELQPWLHIYDESCTVDRVDLFLVLEMDANSPYFLSDNFKASMLLIIMRTIMEFINLYQSLSAFPEMFLPISTMLHKIQQSAKLPGVLRSIIEEVIGLIRKKSSEVWSLRRPLQMRKRGPEPIKTLKPKFEDNYVKGIDYDPDRERAKQKKLKKLVKEETKRVERELRKDNRLKAELKQRDRLLQEEERAERYGKARAFLQEQQHAFVSGQLGRGRKRRK